MTTGLFIGRFQPFHLGHLKDVKDALKVVDQLIIGIGSINEKNTEKNPFSVEERTEMIKYILNKENITNYSIFTIPDFHDDQKWFEYIEKMSPDFNVVFTGNDWTVRCFKNKGYKIIKINLIKNINSTIIRNRIINDENWQELVPKGTVEFLEKIDGLNKIKNI